MDVYALDLADSLLELVVLDHPACLQICNLANKGISSIVIQTGTRCWRLEIMGCSISSPQLGHARDNLILLVCVYHHIDICLRPGRQKLE